MRRQMRGEILRNLSFSRARAPQPDRTEPRLVPANAPLPFRRAPDQNPVLSARLDDEPSLPTANITADQRAVPAAARPAAPLRELALAGCVVLGVGIVAGAGFLLLPLPSTESAGTTAPNAPGPLPANPPAAPTPSAATPATATATIPGGSNAQHAAADHSAAPSPPVAAPALLPAAPVRASPAVAAVAAAPAVKSPRTAVPATGVSAAPPAAKAHPVPDKRAAALQTEMHRPAHVRRAVQHARLEAARDTRPSQPQSHSAQFPAARQPLPSQPSERPARSARPSTSAGADQAASFDRLMNQLTGPARPASADQALSPPAADAPDPFAQRAPDK